MSISISFSLWLFSFGLTCRENWVNHGPPVLSPSLIFVKIAADRYAATFALACFLMPFRLLFKTKTNLAQAVWSGFFSES